MLTDIYLRLTELASTSPILAGVISLWGLTVITFLIRTIPAKIFSKIKTQLITSLEFDNAQGYYHQKIYYSCMQWLSENKGFLRFSRFLSIYTYEGWDDDLKREIESVILGPGYGTHWFIYKGKIMWMVLSAIESSGSELQKRSILLKYFGRNKSILDSFIKEFAPKEKKNEIFSYHYNDSWRKNAPMKKRPIESLALDYEIKQRLLNDIKHFNSNEDWFVSKGLPYKLTYILHGIPGTGKTSTIKTLASYYDKNLCILNIGSVSDTSFQRALSQTPPNSFVVIEDFDSTKAARKRRTERSEDSNGDKHPLSKIEECDFTFTTLSGLLNGLDGIENIHNVIIFLTTNHLDKIDPALYRKGRVDHIIEFRDIPAVAVKEYSEYIFPEYSFDGIIFTDTIGCNLNSALLGSKGDPARYTDLLFKDKE
jgi:chaperone BCS1